MKKFVVCLIAGMVVVVSGSAFAAVNFPDINVSGELSLKAITADNYDAKDKDNDKVQSVQLYTILGLTGQLTDGVTANATIRKAGKEYGSPDSEKVEDYSTKLELETAYLTVANVADKVNLTVGRQEIGERFNSLVYYSPGADAIKAAMTCGPVDLTGIYGKASTATKTNLYALLAATKVAGVSVNGGIYALQATTPGNTNQVLDVAASCDCPMVEGLSCNLEYAMQSGKQNDNDRKGTAMKVGVDYGMETAMGKLTCGLTYLNTSGTETGNDVKAYSGIAPSMKVTEIMSDMGASGKNDDAASYSASISNLTAIMLKLGMDVTEKIALGLAYGNYKESEKVGTSDKIGSEINLTAGYKQSDAVSFGLLLAQYTPEKGDKATKLQAGMKVAFK